MALRMGVTVAEENALKRAAAEGQSWNEARQLLTDVDEDYVKKNLWEPLSQAAEAKALEDAPPPSTTKKPQ